MKINLINDSLMTYGGLRNGKKCFYFEIVKNNKTEVSSDFAVSNLLGIEEKEYRQRLIKAFNRSYTMDKGELYLTFDNLNNLNTEDLINKFKEEFFSELITAQLSN